MKNLWSVYRRWQLQRNVTRMNATRRRVILDIIKAHPEGLTFEEIHEELNRLCQQQ